MQSKVTILERMNKAMTPQKTMMRRHKGYAFLPTATFMLTFILVTALAIVAFLTLRKFVGFEIEESAATLAAISGAGISIAGSFAAVLLAMRSLQQGERTFELERRALNLEAEAAFRSAMAGVHEDLENLRSSSDQVVAAVEDLSSASNVSYTSVFPKGTNAGRSSDHNEESKSDADLSNCKEYSIEERQHTLSSLSEARDRLCQSLTEFVKAYDQYRSNSLISWVLRFKSVHQSPEKQSHAKRVAAAIEDVVQLLSKESAKAYSQLDSHRQSLREEYDSHREQQSIANEDHLAQAEDYVVALDEEKTEHSSERQGIDIERADAHSFSGMLAQLTVGLREATPEDLVARRAVARFSNEVASKGAIFDFRRSGGFHLRATQRGKWVTEKKKNGPGRKASFVQNRAEDELLDIASWLDEPEKIVCRTELPPSLKLFILSDGCSPFFFPKHSGKKTENPAKGGSLPKRAVYLNDGALTLIKAIGALPSGKDIQDFLRFYEEITAKFENDQTLDQFEGEVFENLCLPSGGVWKKSFDQDRIDREMHCIFADAVSDLSHDVGRSFLPLVSSISPLDQKGENKKIDAATDLRFGLRRKRDLKLSKRCVAKIVNT